MQESAHPASMTGPWPPQGVATLFDSYHLLGVIGQGGMGTVYQGYHLSLKRFVAIKVLRVDLIPRPDLMSRFLREMQAVGQMDHPNVVRAADAGKRNGVFYLVMEYLNGVDLYRLVTERGPLGVADACERTRQAAVGLEYIHQTLVHRDVKPSNLMLTTSGLVKILDLGLARLHEVAPVDWEGTPAGYVLGTCDYLAPEQAIASNLVDGRADIYSLGCTLFKLLTGRPPFPNPEYDSAAQKQQAHANLSLIAAPNFASIPEALRPVLLRMTAKNPADRYPAARDVAEALAPFAVGSQPSKLLEAAGGYVAPTMQPLPTQLPEELERLTLALAETPSHIPSGPTIRQPTPPTNRRQLLAMVFVALLLVLFALLLFLVWHRTGNLPSTSPPSLPPSPSPNRLDQVLDERDLLTRQPVLLIQPKHDFVWHYDKEKREFNFLASNTCLFQLGESATTDFGFEVVMERNSPDDQSGLFFGYRRGPDGNQPDIGRYYTFTIRNLNPLLEKREGAALELYHVRINFDTGNRILTQTPFSVAIPTPRGDQRIRVRVEQGKIVQLGFGTRELTDQLPIIPPLKERGGGFGVFCEKGSGFVRSAKLLIPKKEP